MSTQSPTPMELYARVLDQRAQSAQLQLAQVKSRLLRTQQQIDRLDQTAQQSQLKNSAGNVAFYANAAGFRSEVWAMAEQMRDAHNVLALECTQVQQLVYSAMQQHSSVECVVQKARAKQVSEQVRQSQKLTDELASQAWSRQRRPDLAESPISRESCA